MKETIAEWSRTVDDILSVPSSKYSRSLAKIMDSPLVFSLVGGHYADVTGEKLGVYMANRWGGAGAGIDGRVNWESVGNR